MSIQSDISVNPSLLAGALQRNRLLLTLVLVHLGCALLIAQSTGMAMNPGTLMTMLLQLPVMLLLFGFIVGYCRYRWVMIVVKPDNNMQWYKADMRRILLDPDRLMTGVIAFLCYTVFTGAFSYIKETIPVMVPFSWDPALAELDRALHGGIDPWRLLQPVFGNAVMTAVLNALYHLWFFMMYFMLLWACFDIRNYRKSMVFLTGFVLTWAMSGNLFATLLSSVGPVYYAAFGFGDTFEPLMQALQGADQIIPVWALDVQQMLLNNYHHGGSVRGISAMPSMHVASSVIMTLYIFSLSRWMGWVMVGFTTAIVIGSVHLAWHYAVDGYAGIAIALACWWLGRRIVDRFTPEL